MTRRLILVAMAATAALTAPRAADPPGVFSGAPARRILVIAKFQEPDRRYFFESTLRDELRKVGVEMVAGSEVLTDADFATIETLKAKIAPLGVDGVLGYTVLGVAETVKQGPSVGIGVGAAVPTPMGPYGSYVGASMPLGGGPTVVRTVRIRGRFFNRSAGDPAWEKVFKEQVKTDIVGLATKIASDSVRALKKKKLLARD